MKRKSWMLILWLALLPLASLAQLTHEGELKDKLMVGRHVWKNAAGQIKAEVIYDESGGVKSFRTWDEAGLLVDEVKLDPKRKHNNLPPLSLTFEEDGFGFLLIHGQARDDAPKAMAGERVAVYYEGSLQDGTIFDSNYGNKKPLKFKFQMGEVVPGFDRAVSMLRVGEEGYFWLPSSLAYGEHVAGTIPPFSNLLFRIKLVDLN